MALLKNEILGIDCVERMLDRLDLERYADLAELIQDLEAIFRQRLEEHGIVEAVNRLIKKKLDKVARYLQEQ